MLLQVIWESATPLWMNYNQLHCNKTTDTLSQSLSCMLDKGEKRINWGTWTCIESSNKLYIIWKKSQITIQDLDGCFKWPLFLLFFEYFLDLRKMHSKVLYYGSGAVRPAFLYSIALCPLSTSVFSYYCPVSIACTKHLKRCKEQ